MTSDALFDDLLKLLEQQEMENRQASTREEQNSLVPTSSPPHVPNGASMLIRQMFTNPPRQDPTPSTSQERSSISHASNPSTSQTPSYLNSRERTTSRSRRTSSSRSRRTSCPHRTSSTRSRQTADRAHRAIDTITQVTTSSPSQNPTPSTSHVARTPALFLVPANIVQNNVYSNLQRPAPSCHHEPSESLPQNSMAPRTIAISSGSLYVRAISLLTIRTNTENDENVFVRPRPVPAGPNTQSQSRQGTVNEENANVPPPPLMPPVPEERSVSDEYLDMDTTLFPELYI